MARKQWRGCFVFSRDMNTAKKEYLENYDKIKWDDTEPEEAKYDHIRKYKWNSKAKALERVS